MKSQTESKLRFVAGALLYAGLATLVCPQEARNPAEKWQVDGIAAALQDPLPGVRVLALKKVNRSKLNWQGVPPGPILPFLWSPNLDDARAAAAGTIGAIQATDQAEELVGLLKDSNPLTVRRAAAQARYRPRIITER